MSFSNFKKFLFSFLFIFATGIFAFALSVPELTGPVVDNAQLLSREEFSSLTSELVSLSEETGMQIAVLTISSLKGESLEEYSMRVCEEWKLGSKKNDDGVLLLISFEDRKIRIEVGYGLEDKLTDTKCGIIIRQIIAPAFQRRDYSKGIIDAVHAIEKTIESPNAVITLGKNDRYETSDAASSIIVIIFVLFYFFVFTGVLSRKFKWLRWLPWFSLFQGSSSNHRSNHHDDFFGGFGGGGFGGGGFSGGGGGFGGGGASGGW